MRTLAVEWAPQGVRVNAVAPGYIDNIMTGVRYDDNDPYQRRVINFTPMRRRGAREEFLGAYIFLASEAASFVTGEIIYVDGGYTRLRYPNPTSCRESAPLAGFTDDGRNV